MKRPAIPPQPTLFDWTPPQIAVGYSDDVTGRGPLENRIARLISRALRDARDDMRLTREDIAEGISEHLGRKVSAEMLNKWSSEGAEGHRIPLDAFIGLVKATQQLELLGFIPEMFDLVVVPQRFRDLIELKLIEEQQEKLAARAAMIKRSR
jgi:hypothetical protein